MPKDVAARIGKLRETLRYHERLYYVLDQPEVCASRSRNSRINASCYHSQLTAPTRSRPERSC
jgi:hypothetical protein